MASKVKRWAGNGSSNAAAMAMGAAAARGPQPAPKLLPASEVNLVMKMPNGEWYVSGGGHDPLRTTTSKADAKRFSKNAGATYERAYGGKLEEA